MARTDRCTLEGSAVEEQLSFNDLLSRLESGENDAATELFRRFAARLIAKARSRLSPAIRTKVDAEDVVQSVYRSFFRRFDEGQFELQDWESLWGLLLTITLRKCNRQRARFHADKRDVAREISLAVSADNSAPVWEGTDRQPTPEEAAALSETVEQVMRHCTPRQRDILTLSLQGYTQQEISRQIGCSERTVRRVVKFVQEDLEALKRVMD